MSSTWIENGESIIVFELNDSNQIITVIKKGFLSKVGGKIFVCSKLVGFCKSGRYVLTKCIFGNRH